MQFENLIELVENWATERCIIQNSSSTTQLMKAFSEMGELADATIKKDRDEQIDAVGDVLVCLINYCAIEGIVMTQALQSAYDVIKDRKGMLLTNGVFLKEEDFKK